MDSPFSLPVFSCFSEQIFGLICRVFSPFSDENTAMRLRHFEFKTVLIAVLEG